MIDVQAFLTNRRSGLAGVTIGGFLGIGSIKASDAIANAAKKYYIKPEFILTTLEAEQNLITDTAVRPAAFKIYSLPATNGDVLPPATHGGKVYRHTGKDGTRFIEYVGDLKMGKATGAGIPDPGTRVSWDLRNYFGFENQIDQTAKLARKFMEDYYGGNKLVTLYPAGPGLKPETIKAGDPETYVLLMYTPSPAVLSERPSIYRKYFA